MLTASLGKPATKYGQRKLQKLMKETREETAQRCKQHPELAQMFKESDLFNFTYHAVSLRNEKLLDELWAERELLAPGDVMFSNQVKLCRAQLRIHEQKLEEAIPMLIELAGEEICANRSHVLIYLIELYEKEKDYKSAAAYVHAYMDYSDKQYKSEKTWVDLSVLPFFLEILGMAGEYENVIAIG